MIRKIVFSAVVLVAIGFLVYWQQGGQNEAAKTGEVHFAPTHQKVVDEMLAMARVGPEDVIYDLGCGDGRIVITAAQRWRTRGVGIDIDPRLVRLSQRNAVRAKVENLVSFYEADLFATDLSEATVAALYLLPGLNLRRRPNLLREMRPGSRVVSHSWDMGDWTADEARLSTPYWNEWVPGDEPKRSPLFMWVIPANVSGVWRWSEGKDGGIKELRISQRFQKGQGVISAPTGEMPVLVEITGNRLRVTTQEKNAAKTRKTLYEGTAEGDVIEGTAMVNNGAIEEGFPWRASRTPHTMMDLENKTPSQRKEK